ncbi:M48 family metallopeptidase [Flavobacteriales bacterium]|nr:M48 family metallopeptidase [Flavobacteriales bacterium]
MSKIENIEGIGEVNFVKSKRAKNLRISIKPFHGVKVTMPYYMSYKTAKRFLNLKKSWVEKNLNEIKNKEVGRTVFDENTVFRTNLHSLKIIREGGKEVKSRRTNELITIKVPLEFDIYSEPIQKFIRKNIEESWRIEAKATLPQRTQELAAKYGFIYNNVSIRNTLTRWGSCSYQNNINFSLHLLRLPEGLQDYVILHELAHTKEKNHQPPFWKLLDSVTNGNARVLDKQVKKYTTRIY